MSSSPGPPGVDMKLPTETESLSHSTAFEFAVDASGAWKWAVRQRIWDYMEDNDIADFPRPVHRRIPAFKNAAAAAHEQFVKLPEFGRAQTIKINPDTPQKPVRFLGLQHNKTLIVPQPRLKNGFFSVLEPSQLNLSNKQQQHAATSRGLNEYGRPVGPWDALPKVDLVVVGSVAVDPKTGARIGKGEGFAEIEYGILRMMGHIDEHTPVVTVVHDCQLVGEKDLPAEKFLKHDVFVDIVVTPTQTIRVAEEVVFEIFEITASSLIERVMRGHLSCAAHGHHDRKVGLWLVRKSRKPQPEGIYWDLLTPEKLRDIKALREVRSRLEAEGRELLTSDHGWVMVGDPALNKSASSSSVLAEDRDDDNGGGKKGKRSGHGKGTSKGGGQGRKGGKRGGEKGEQHEGMGEGDAGEREAGDVVGDVGVNQDGGENRRSRGSRGKKVLWRKKNTEEE